MWIILKIRPFSGEYPMIFKIINSNLYTLLGEPPLVELQKCCPDNEISFWKQPVKWWSITDGKIYYFLEELNEPIWDDGEDKWKFSSLEEGQFGIRI